MISDFVAGTVVCSLRAVSMCEQPSNSRRTSAIRWRSGQARDLGDDLAHLVAILGVLRGVGRRHGIEREVVVVGGALGSAQLVERAVADDHVQPRSQGHRAVGHAQPAVGADERVLHDVVGVVSAALQHAACEAVQGAAVAAVDLVEGRFVAAAKAGDELVVGTGW